MALCGVVTSVLVENTDYCTFIVQPFHCSNASSSSSSSSPCFLFKKRYHLLEASQNIFRFTGSKSSFTLSYPQLVVGEEYVGLVSLQSFYTFVRFIFDWSSLINLFSNWIILEMTVKYSEILEYSIVNLDLWNTFK